MTTVAIVVALVLVAVVAFAVFFARGKGGAQQLQAPRPSTGGAPRQMPPARSEPPSPRRLGGAVPPRVESGRPPRPLVSEAAPVARDAHRPAQPSGPPSTPPSKKDVAGLRK